MTALEIAFWVSAALLVYAQVGYGLLLGGVARVRRGWVAPGAVAGGEVPDVTLVVAAYQEADVIEAKLANLFALDYPRERLQVIVSCDGSTDGTPELARRAGADLVLENPRGGKVRTQDAAVARARGRSSPSPTPTPRSTPTPSARSSRRSPTRSGRSSFT